MIEDEDFCTNSDAQNQGESFLPLGSVQSVHLYLIFEFRVVSRVKVLHTTIFSNVRKELAMYQPSPTVMNERKEKWREGNTLLIEGTYLPLVKKNNITTAIFQANVSKSG